jgi:starvation-inducible DNA-binding protein
MTLQIQPIEMEISTVELLEKNQVKVIDILNNIFVNESMLSSKTRNCHWNVVGPNFSELHRFFDEQHIQLDCIINQIATRRKVLGGNSNALMTEFLVKISLKESPKQYPEALQMIFNLLRDHKVMILNLRNDLETCIMECHDMNTSNFLTDIVEKHEKMVLMLMVFLDTK